MNVQLLIIDPQIDFMDLPGSTLPVPGANDDMNRLAHMIRRIGRKINDIHVTLDSHHELHIANPGMWRDQRGQRPAPFTLITHDDVKAGIWTPILENVPLSVLGGQTMRQYALDYTAALEAQGLYTHMIWPEHCLIGSAGHSVHTELRKALGEWAVSGPASVDWVTKGACMFTEHFGGLVAQVPLATDPSTGLNTQLLDTIMQADIVAIAGEAASHCLKATVTQIVDNIDPNLVEKFVLLADATSPIPHNPGGPDFPSIYQSWLTDMKRRGMKVSTTTDFLS